jgi:phenylacetate-CoA ligase
VLALKSAIPGILWPSVPSGGSKWQMFALQQQLMESQWLDPQALRERQLGQVGRLLGHAYDEIPFYRRRLDAAGYRPDRPLTSEIWRQVPILTRADIQRERDALTSPKPPPGHGASLDVRSSGSTGKPIEVYVSEIARYFSQVFAMRDHLWHGRDRGGKFAEIRAGDVSAQPAAGNAIQDHQAESDASAESNGSSLRCDIRRPIEQQAEWLSRSNPDYLTTHPSNLLPLAKHCQENGIAIPQLRQVATISEVLDPETRVACREAWGVEIADVYSSMESGVMALQCPEHEHYHVQSEGTLLEVLDGDRVCQPGEVGRVVATRLHNFAMPLIREEVGDYAEVGAPCPCGRGLPVLKRILGRARNLVTLPTGERYWPILGGRSLTAVAPIRQYQIVQTSVDDITARLVVPRKLTGEEEEKVKKIICDRLGYPFALTLTYHDEIPRDPGGKFEDFRSEIAQ